LITIQDNEYLLQRQYFPGAAVETGQGTRTADQARIRQPTRPSSAMRQAVTLQFRYVSIDGFLPAQGG
jgi:hypothetical protein